MAYDVRDRETLLGQKLEHAGDQLLEFLWVKACGAKFRVICPEKVRPLSFEKIVPLVLLMSPLKGRMSSVHDEEDHTESEQINDLALVIVIQENLGGHVGWSATLHLIGTRTIFSLKRGSKTEINDLNVVICC